ncbi:MAG: hypothetical protein WCB96_00270, partial [Candidatus Aminicenantales bacterium]
KDGAWVYNEGRIVEAKVGLSQNFDPDVFFISKMVCQNCNKIANLKGQSLSGSVQGQTVNLKWPDVMTSAIVTNKIKPKFVSKEKSQEGYSDNYFISEDFFHWTWTHNLPLIDNKEVKFQMEKKSSKSRFKLDKRPPISLYYRYVLKKIK